MKEVLTRSDIKEWCASSTIYQRGVNYFNEGRVLGLVQSNGDRSWAAVVEGSYEYEVHIYITDDNIDATCDCPAYDRQLECKHIVAVMLQIEEVQMRTKREDHRKNVRKGKVNQMKYNRADVMIQSFENQVDLLKQKEQTLNKQPLEVEYICNPVANTSGHLLTIEMKTGINRPYVVKNLSEFLQCIEHQSDYFFTNKFTYNPSEHYFLAEDIEIINDLQKIRKLGEFYRKQQGYYYSSGDSDRRLTIPPSFADALFSKLQERNLLFQNQKDVKFQSYEDKRELPLTFQLKKGTSGDFQLDLSSLQSVSYYGAYNWLVHDHTVYKLSSVENGLFKTFYQYGKQPNDSILPVAQNQVGDFISHVLPRLKQIGRVEVTEQVSNQIFTPKLITKFFMDWKDERLTAKVEFHYGTIVIDPFKPDQVDEPENGAILIREIDNEKAVMEIIESSSFKYNGKECYLDEEEAMYEFFFTALPELQEKADIYMTGPVQKLIFPKENVPMAKIDTNTAGNLLEISFNMDSINQHEVNEIFQSIVERKKYHRLSSGAFVSLEGDDFQGMNQLMNELQVDKGDIKDGVIALPAFRSLQVDHILHKKDQSFARTGKNFRQMIHNLKNPDTIDLDVPASLTNILRDYQHFGFGWLKTMAHYRLGGILADDMGLGKTLQTIAYLLSEKSDRKHEVRPSLVVAPASLVYNWKNEFEKFAPDLEVAVAYGTPEERFGFLDGTKKIDVLITSYPLLRQDIEFYEKIEFDSFILDEAQAIKNHLTKTAKAVKQMKAEKRFALSGTPIENSLDELWSIFDAVLPGFFKSHRSFKNLGQEKIAQMVRPFILRRIKQDVLKELPEKIEVIHHSELTKGQKTLYLGYLERIQHETKESLQNEGFEKSRMKILAGLTRLRQLCCHPALFLENYNDQSGKLEQLLEILQNAIENNRRILVFSQFTSMLKIIRQELEQAKIGYFYLDGQTAAQERVNLTKHFNEGDNNVFLISLKAGGTGLNLTGADMVILYDLWWNPAVEEQAVGRAHRMGQKNSVQVLRLIAKGTIEEKIFEMQQTKKELIEQVIQPGETSLSSLTEDEIRQILGI